ncbi:MAG: efflux RND transporter periplasmic adaptor subunit [Polyangia bacterium]
MSRSLFLSIVLFVACRQPSADEPAPRPPVRVVTTVLSNRSARVSISGVLSPLPGHDVKVGSLVAGRVSAVFVAEGDRVKVGQALAHVDAQPLQAHLTEARAQHVQFDAALGNSRTRLARAEKLFADGITSRQDVDDARAALVAARSAVQQAQAGMGTATSQLERATLRSPIDGVVAAILVPAGQPVDGNATPVIEVTDARELDLRAPIPVSQAAMVTLGQAAELTLEDRKLQGRVVAIAPLVDTATNTVVVRVRVSNTDGALRAGAFVRGALLGAMHEAVVVPKTALLPGDGGSASEVAIVGVDDTVTHRRITVRSEDAHDVELDLPPGLRVIVDGGYSLPDGTHVQVVP